MNTLTARQLKDRMEEDPDLLIINTLDRENFEDAHIPGSVNIPRSDDAFVEKVLREAGTTDRDIVVYCASEACNSSPQAARRLEESGFTSVYDFESGTKGWQQAGFDLAGQLVGAGAETSA